MQVTAWSRSQNWSPKFWRHCRQFTISGATLAFSSFTSSLSKLADELKGFLPKSSFELLTNSAVKAALKEEHLSTIEEALLEPWIPAGYN